MNCSSVRECAFSRVQAKSSRFKMFETKSRGDGRDAAADAENAWKTVRASGHKSRLLLVGDDPKCAAVASEYHRAELNRGEESGRRKNEQNHSPIAEAALRQRIVRYRHDLATHRRDGLVVHHGSHSAVPDHELRGRRRHNKKGSTHREWMGTVAKLAHREKFITWSSK